MSTSGFGDLPAAVHGLGTRFGLQSLQRRHNSRAVLGTYVLINSAITIAILSAVAMLTKQPFIFPSLGLRHSYCFSQPRTCRPRPAAPSSAI